MKKRISLLIFLIFLTPAILSPLWATDAVADTRITITFAAGGAACGVSRTRYGTSSNVIVESIEPSMGSAVTYPPTFA